MENPQKEYGYIPIANEIVEALVNYPFNGTELRIVLFVLRRTWGFGKKEDWISLSQFEEALGIHRMNVCRALNSLVAKQLLVAEKLPYKTVYGFNKLYSQWLVAKRLLVANPLRSSSKSVQKVVAKELPTKDNIQKTITKERVGEPSSPTPAQTARKFFENEDFEPYRTKLLENGANETIVDQELKKFWVYWTEPNKSGTKKRWELQLVFDIPRRLSTWFSRVGNGSGFGGGQKKGGRVVVL